MISQKDKLKAIQEALGTKPDGILGPHTTDVLYRQFADTRLPYEGKFFGCKVMLGNAEDIIPVAANRNYAVKDFTWSMSGSFSSRDYKPVCILIADGIIFRDYSCHYPTRDGNCPETVLWYNSKTKKLGLSLARRSADLPDLENIKWAIGGGQIAPNFNNVTEGFVGKFSDVFRKTAHCAIGYDQFGNILGVYHHNCTLNNFQTRCLNIGMVEGIFLDGGHISAMNAGTLTANTRLKQGYIIQF